MFNVITEMAITFNRDLDEEKLKEFKKIKTIDSNARIEICLNEIHFIMQRHFKDPKIIKISYEALQYLQQIKRLKRLYHNQKFN